MTAGEPAREGQGGDTLWPPYAFVPGGRWPHPSASPDGHSFGHEGYARVPVEGDDWGRSFAYRRGIDLFNAGYYWEAHEAWEALWNAHGRRGPVADTLKALIKMAAAGVKVREAQPRGVVTHARRAALLFAAVRSEAGPRLLGLDLDALARQAGRLADAPPTDPAPPGVRVSVVFDFRLEPTPGPA